MATQHLRGTTAHWDKMELYQIQHDDVAPPSGVCNQFFQAKFRKIKDLGVSLCNELI